MRLKFDRQLSDLVISQAIIMVIPIVATPLIILRYGIDGLGLLALGQSTAAIIAISYELGYALRNQKVAGELYLMNTSMRSLYKETLIVKALILILILGVVNIFFWSQVALDRMINYNLLTLAHFFIAAAPTFYFYASGEIRKLMFVNVIFRFIPLVFLVLVVYVFEEVSYNHNITHYIMVLSIANFLNLIVLVTIFSEKNPFTQKITFWDLGRSLSEAWKYAKISYLSQLTINLPIQVLGQIAALDLVGQFSLAEKIVNAVKSVQSQVLLLYQKDALKILQAQEKGTFFKILKRSSLFLGLLLMFALSSFVLFLFVKIYSVQDYYFFSYCVILLALSPVLIHISSLVNIHVFANLNNLRPANVSLSIGLISCLILLGVSIIMNYAILIPVSVVITEAIVLIVAIFYLDRGGYVDKRR